MKIRKKLAILITFDLISINVNEAFVLKFQFTDIELTVKGNHAPTIMTNDIHFWTLSPPKLHIQPAIIKQMMCPLYYGSFNPGRYISFENKKRTEKKTAAEKLLDNFIDKDEEEIEQLLKER